MSLWTPCPACHEPLFATDHDYGCPHPRRYAIRHEDGRFLALAHANGRIIPLWLPEEERHKAWTWPTMTSAVMAALDVEQADLSAVGPWDVVPYRVS
jgi:hypothetical protein